MYSVEAPQQKFIHYTVKKFITEGTVLHGIKEKAGAPITTRSPENLDTVHACVLQNSQATFR